MQDKNFQLELLIKTISASSQKAVFLHIPQKEETNLFLNDLIFISSFKNKLPSWSYITTINIQDCFLDIQNIILQNIKTEALIKKQENTFFKRKILVPFLKKELSDVYKIKSSLSDDVKKRKNLFWPILNTISSFGMALGVPMFSALLFRQNEIVSNHDLGNGFFKGMLSLALILIIISIITMILSLINTIIKNRKENIYNFTHNNLEKIIKKYFILDPNSNSWKNKFKFKITEKYLFFYTNADCTSPQYTECLNLLNIINLLGSQYVLVFNKKLDYVEKNIFKNIIEPSKVQIIDTEKYKNNINIKQLINFILYQVTLMIGVSSRVLLQRYPLFTNALYRFIDFSNSNVQLLKLIKTIQSFLGDLKDIESNSNIVKYFTHLFVLATLKSLDESIYEKIYFDLTNKGFLSDELNNNVFFNSLKIKEVFNENANLFNKSSLYFLFADFFNENINLIYLIQNNKLSSTLVIDKNEWLEKIEDKAVEKEYEKIENELPAIFDLAFKNKTNDLIYAKYITAISSNADTWNNLEHIFKSAKELKIEFLIIEIFNKTLYYQLLDNEYELITSFLL